MLNTTPFYLLSPTSICSTSTTLFSIHLLLQAIFAPKSPFFLYFLDLCVSILFQQQCWKQGMSICRCAALLGSKKCISGDKFNSLGKRCLIMVVCNPLITAGHHFPLLIINIYVPVKLGLVKHLNQSINQSNSLL